MKRADADGAVKFGTDGWRGIIAREFTFDNVGRAASALADYLRDDRRAENSIYTDWNAPFRSADRGAIVGYDTRFLSEEFALHFAEILQDRGIPVSVSDRFVPTPALSYAVADRSTAVGIMFTSSHNPALYNGLKVKAEYGGSAPESVTSQIEAHLPDHPPVPPSSGDSVPRVDLRTPYLNRIRKLIDRDRLTSSPIRVVVDSMYGSAQGCVAELLREIGIPFVQIRSTRDVLFGGKKPEPLEENLVPLRAVIRSTKRDHRRLIGVVTDGDGDRISAMDEAGRFVDAHRTYALILRYLVEERGWRGAVVVSFNLSDLIRRMCDAYDLPIVEIPIGFKHAVQQILTRDVMIAGEESGSIALRGHIPERDGVLLSMLLAEILAVSDAPLSRMVETLHERFGPQVYRRCDIEIERRREVVEALRSSPPDRFAGRPVRAVETLDGVKLRFDDAWLLFRASGTEPILRMYSEARTEQEIDALLDAARTFAQGV